MPATDSSPTLDSAKAPEGLMAQMPLLQSLMTAFEKETGMFMSFDDQTGAMTGFHRDVPAMELDWSHQSHSCSFCQFAQSDIGFMDCVLNKLAANRLACHRREGWEGFCHLGLFEVVEPLIYLDHVLGVFYYGSVKVKGQESLTTQKILRYCARRGIDPAGHLEAARHLTVIDPESIPRHREALKTVARLAHFFCETAGVQPEVYRSRELKFPYTDPKELPYVVKQTMLYIRSHIDEHFIVKDLATYLHCHPDFLSRKFKQHTGVDLSNYLQQARVDRAKRLLENPKMDIGTAADQSGFSDRVHFSKVFRRVTGYTPGQFQRRFTRKV